MKMNDSQQLFSIFYAVLYGSMLASLQDFKLFQWGNINKHRKRISRRLVFSIIIFNIMPLVIFAFIYNKLGDKNYFDGKYLNFWIIILLGFTSLAIFIPYRLWHLLMVLLRKKCWLYSFVEYKKIRRERRIGECWQGHLLGIVFYSLGIIIIFYSELVALIDILEKILEKIFYSTNFVQ